MEVLKMIGKNTIGKVVTALVLGGMVIANGSMAYAQGTSSTKNYKASAVIEQAKGVRRGAATNAQGIKTLLDGLVKSGTINQTQEDSIINYIQQNASAMKTQMEKVKAMTPSERQAYFQQNKTQTKTDFLADLITNGTITQDQANCIKTAMNANASKNANNKSKTNGFKTILDGYVTAGTITQDEETKIENFMQQKASDAKAQMEKLKSMTQAERQAYFKQNKTQKTDILSQLVSQGIITQTQADAMTKLKPSANNKNAEQNRKGMGTAQLKTKLDSLVTAGTITATQETAVEGLFAPSTNNTSNTGSAKTSFKTKLDGLVTAGTLTSDQETAILNLFAHHAKTTTPAPAATQTQQ